MCWFSCTHGPWPATQRHCCHQTAQGCRLQNLRQDSLGPSGRTWCCWLSYLELLRLSGQADRIHHGYEDGNVPQRAPHAARYADTQGVTWAFGELHRSGLLGISSCQTRRTRQTCFGLICFLLLLPSFGVWITKILTVCAEAQLVWVVFKVPRIWAGLGGHLGTARFIHLHINIQISFFKDLFAVPLRLCCDHPVPGCTERAFVQSGRVRLWTCQFPSWLAPHSTAPQSNTLLSYHLNAIETAGLDCWGPPYLEECRRGLLSGRPEVLTVDWQDLVTLHQLAIWVDQATFHDVGHKHSCVVPSGQRTRTPS